MYREVVGLMRHREGRTLKDVMITGDFTHFDWLLLVEDCAGNGRVRGYWVFATEEEARNCVGTEVLCELLDLEMTEATVTEIMTYGDFRNSYGDRMPLTNRGEQDPRR